MSDFTSMPVPEISVTQADFPSTHWPSRKFFINLLPDCLIKHALGLAGTGMTDIGEVFEVVDWLEPDNEERWLNAWCTMGRRLQLRAIDDEKAGNNVSAASSYLRASTYWRMGLNGFGKEGDPRIEPYCEACRGSYRKHLELSGFPGEAIEIPYEDTTLPGYFYRSPIAEANAPILVINPGKDTWAEDTRWLVDGALKRGIHALTFEGPGQGFTLRMQGLKYRPDWENVIGPVLDYVETIPGVDKSRIALLGISFGGYLIGRAAAFEPRIKVLLPDSGNLKWGEDIERADFPKYVDTPFEDLPLPVRNLTRDYAFKFGIEPSVKAVYEALKLYDNTENVDKISCTVIALDGVAEVFTGSKAFYDALSCPKEYLCFDADSTAQMHGQCGGYQYGAEKIFNTLEKYL